MTAIGAPSFAVTSASHDDVGLERDEDLLDRLKTLGYGNLPDASWRRRIQ